MKDCYGHIETCYRSSPSTDHDICSALLPTCYVNTEQETPDGDCYIAARDCLVSDHVDNAVCHQHLRQCLHEEEEGGGHSDDEECGLYVEECLTDSSLSSSQCYDYLQHYLSGNGCSQDSQKDTEHQYHQDPQYQQSYERPSYSQQHSQNHQIHEDNDYWNNFMNNIYRGVRFYA